MSVNWVMLAESGGFTPLPGEKTLYTSPPRTALQLQSLNRGGVGAEAFNVASSGGVVFLSNRRLIYLPANPTPSLTSFAAPILNLHDTHVTAPWFGPNVWTALVQPVPGGGIPAAHAALELKLTFKEGGAFDFHTSYERLKERLLQAVEGQRESSVSGGAGTPGVGVDWDRVHLEDLPAYDAAGSSVASVPTSPTSPLDREGFGGPAIQAPRATVAPLVDLSPQASPTGQVFQTPVEPPPGYEEVQRGSIVEELERRIRSGEVDEER